MTFGDPLWILLALPAAVLFAWMAWAGARRSRQRLARFAMSSLLARLTPAYSPTRHNLKTILAGLALLAILAALARPQWGHFWEETEAIGIDILIAIDTSRSMLAEDIRPNRLERAKLAVLDLLDQLEGDRVGIIAFAGTAFLQSPLTLDYEALRGTLRSVDTATIPVPGTNLAAAIAEARQAFGKEKAHKILVVLTDGEDLEAAGIAAARQAAEEDGLRIFTVGVGGTQGELVPIRTSRGEVEFLRDASGNFVRSALDERTLETVARASNGFYAHLGTTGEGLRRVYTEGLADIPRETLEGRLRRIPIERYQWPAAFALFLLFLEPLISTRRRKETSAS